MFLPFTLNGVERLNGWLLSVSNAPARGIFTIYGAEKG